MYLKIVGEAVGASEGGVVQQPLFDLQVTTTPDAGLNISKLILVNWLSVIVT